ncbi:glycosyltransferase family 2 protein [Rhodococcus sp. SJ-2]
MNGNAAINIVIVNYFSTEFISSLLEDIDVPSYAGVILVDNSADLNEWIALADLAKRVGAKCLRMEENLGFGVGVNRGVAELAPDPDTCVWILNPDTRVRSETAMDLAGALDRFGADIASPLIVTGSSDRVWFGGGDLDLKRGRTAHWSGVPTGVTECGFITGAAMMVRASAWDRLGGFREDLFMYWEDADLCIRARELGMKMIIDPQVRIWHAVGATTADSGKSALYYFYMQRNRLIVLASTYGVRDLFGWGAVMEACRITFRAVREGESRIEKIEASTRGCIVGMRMLIEEKRRKGSVGRLVRSRDGRG